MKKLLFILLSALSLTAFAQQKKVAVYVTGQESNINKVLGDQLVAAFAKSGKYIAIERTTSFLAELSKEQKYQRTGAVDDNELSRLGKQFGVQLVCVADISEVFGEKYVSARLIDVESAEVINSSNANSPLNSMTELLQVTNKLARELTAKTMQEKAAEELAIKQKYLLIEKELKPMLDNGYIKIGSLYVTTSYSRVCWDKTSAIASECRIGGMTGWRLPTVTEFDMVVGGIQQYQSESRLYPNIMNQLNSIKCNAYFWASDGSYGCYGVARYYDRRGSSDGGLLMLVHDVK